MTIVGELVEEFKETVGDRDEPLILTLTEKNGFVPQAERFKKRLATENVEKYKVVHRNDLAFNPYLLWAGAVAQNTICHEGAISPLYPTFRVRPGFDPRYVGRLLLTPSIVLRYDSIAFGSVPRRRRSSVADFLGLEVPDPPPIEEQRRIAAVLDAADALRAKRREALAKLDSLTQAIFIDMFVREDEAFEDSPVGDLVATGRNMIRTGPFGSQLLHEEFTNEGIAVLGIDNAVQNRFAWGERRFIAREKYEELKRYTVRPGDVLITIMGTTGRVAVVPDDIPTAINTKHLCCITLDQARCLPEFLWAALRFHPAVLRDLGATHGAVMPGLNMGRIKAAQVPVPQLEVQQRFVELKRAVEEQESLAVGSADELDTLFGSLQQRAFRGEL